MELLSAEYDLSIRKQCELLSICRSSYYYKQEFLDESEFANKIRDIYLSSDCRYGYRKISAGLSSFGILANHKKVYRMMRDIGLQGLYPKKKLHTSTSNKDHDKYPYLLNEIMIDVPNKVWATDITYIKIKDRFMYFIAVIDLYSRYILSYELSHNMEVEFCILALQRALARGKPSIFNSDQGSQFTSHVFLKALKELGVEISMDHRGRCFDNIYVERLWRTLKQESIYYYRPETISELEKCIDEFVPWYNNERLHQGLGYKTPKEVYFSIN